MSIDKNLVLKAMESVLPNPASLHEPSFIGNEWKYVKECIDSGWVSSAGGYVEKFEEQLTSICESKYVIATVTGTAALHAALALAGVESENEVLCPNLTFVASANAIVQLGATPHFIDCQNSTLSIDPLKLEEHLSFSAKVEQNKCYNIKTGRKISALICVHTFGHPAELDQIFDVCEKYSLVLIEDAAEALGSRYKTRHVGSHGKLSVISFNGNKTVTTGGGGAILTNDEDLAKLARHITTTAKLPHPWEYRHDMPAYNYRMPNINAALGCAQLENLPLFLINKRNLAEAYNNAFKSVNGLKFFTEPKFAESNYWLNTLILDQENAEEKDSILNSINEKKFSSRPAWTPMHKLPMFENCPRMDVSESENLYARIINLPSSAHLWEAP
ncbi:MAG: LegC family aminotransferase [Pseudomonadota bacterium]|nr:LegC family aminotransferase [Pseudomonadota bacterium]